MPKFVQLRKDQLQTLREQIQRSKQQQVEHRRAERELRLGSQSRRQKVFEVVQKPNTSLKNSSP